MQRLRHKIENDKKDCRRRRNRLLSHEQIKHRLWSCDPHSESTFFCPSRSATCIHGWVGKIFAPESMRSVPPTETEEAAVEKIFPESDRPVSCSDWKTDEKIGKYTGWPQKVSHYQFFKKSHERLPTRLDFFVKLKYESSTIIQSVGNKYSVRDLLLWRH